jgi:hypothetical protein
MNEKMYGNKMFSDRNIVRFITLAGIMFVFLAEGTLTKENFTLSFCGVPASIFVVATISSLKCYRNLVFKDEKYPEQDSISVNIAASMLFPVFYFLSLLIFGILCELDYDLHWNIWAPFVNIIYFVSAFIFFINKLHTNETKEKNEQ